MQPLFMRSQDGNPLLRSASLALPCCTHQTIAVPAPDLISHTHLAAGLQVSRGCYALPTTGSPWGKWMSLARVASPLHSG